MIITCMPGKIPGVLLFPVLPAVSDRKDRTMTNNLNSVIIEGSVGKVEPMHKTGAGTSYISFDVAVNRYYKTGDEIAHEVSYFDVEAWGKLSEAVAGMLVKDAKVRVVGRLKQEFFTKGKRKYSRIKVVAEHIEAAPGQKASA